MQSSLRHASAACRLCCSSCATELAAASRIRLDRSFQQARQYASTLSQNTTLSACAPSSSSSFSHFTSNIKLAPTPTTVPQSVTRSHALPTPTRRQDAHHLLHFLSIYPEVLEDVDRGAAPALASLVRIRHYAGVREVLEAIFLSARRSGKSFSASQINALFSALTARDPSLPPSSIPAMSSLVVYILKRLKYGGHAYNIESLHLLSRAPEYLRPTHAIEILSLVHALTDGSDTNGPIAADDTRLLHNLMTVFAQHGLHEQAEQCMQVILNLDSKTEARDVKPGKGKGREQSRLSATHGLRNFSEFSPHFTSLQTLAGTTYISSHRNITEASRSTDYRSAMAFFNSLLHGASGAVNEGETANSARRTKATSDKPDVYAWTAIMSIAAHDQQRVSSNGLLRVLSKLLHDDAMPNPNIVTYTVVLDGLIRRGDAALALVLFQEEMLPLAKAGHIKLDARALVPIQRAYIALGEIEEAVRVIEFFGKRAPLSQDPTEEKLQITTLARSAVLRQADGQPELLVPDFPPHTSPTGRADSTDFRSLQGTVSLDSILFNELLVSVAKSGRFVSLWLLFTRMEAIYGVPADAATLAILGKAAISQAARLGRGRSLPYNAEDTFLPDADSNSGVHSQQEAEERRMELAAEWGGQKPYLAVRKIFWAMLEGNCAAVGQRASESFLGTAKKLLLSFGKGEENDDELEGIMDQDEIERRGGRRQTRALSRPEEHEQPSPYPHLVPTASNMHMLIAILGYFNHSSQIPLALAYMKELDILPSKRTLCLAIWNYEESGVYTAQLRRLNTWLKAWLGEGNVPSDSEVAEFRKKQWG